MSKRQTNHNIWNRLRRGLAAILSLALLAGLLPAGVVPAQAAHWATPYVNTLVDWGVMRGDISGNMAPERNITRAEFVAMMNRAYGYTRTAGHPFTDVSIRDWYSDDIDIAYNMGYFKGTSETTASPNAPLTREQAAVLLSRNMMLQPTVGETLGFSDTRTLSDWSRGLVGAAAAQGIISGYSNGSFQPKRNITRGEVAAMLVRAIGTPVNTPGDHVLGDVYGNVTVNTSGVKLRDGTIAGNLYLTGGIDLGDVLLENVNVLGEIIISGAGESSSSQSSVLLRNVTADKLLVDSISQQFVTIRAEGNTDIPVTTVRTNAYVDDSSLPGYGLSYIELDGERGTLLQLAGNVKEVLNKTPESDLQVVQGSADKITIDEDAVGSTVLVDGDARVDELDLDVATTVTGDGDIKDLNVGAAGSTVTQLPDNITIRPGITSDINGSEMNSSQAAESSADPRLEAGYPKVKNIAPTSADLVFKANKSGTIYWAVSAVTDGSVSEDDLIEPPVYGGKILQSGSISVTSSKEEYTTSINSLTQDGSYYVSAILVDGRGNRSPLKVTAFSTPDGTTPAFNQGYPVMTMITTENAQVTVMTNKSCRLYYALLPAGSTAPTPQEFKANAVRGNLGYGVRDAVKNVTQPINVNSTPLQELTNYTLYLWLTDYDGAKSSQVYSLNFRTPDQTGPVIVSKEQTNADANSIELTFSLDEAATLFWAIVPEGEDFEMAFEGCDADDYTPGDGVVFPDADKDEDQKALLRRLQIKIEAGGGNSIKNGRKAVNAAYANAQVTMNETRPLEAGTSSYTMYLVAKDAAGNYSRVEKVNVKTRDNIRPTVKQEFTSFNQDTPDQPLADTDIRLVFSEGVRPGLSDTTYLELYQAVENAAGPREEAAARDALGKALHNYIQLYYGPVGSNQNEAPFCAGCHFDDASDKIVYDNSDPDTWTINYCKAQIKMENGQMVVTFPTTSKDDNALHLVSGSTYHFYLYNIRDNADEANLLDPNPTELPAFTVSFAEVELTELSHRPPVMREAKERGANGATIFKAKEDGTLTEGTDVPENPVSRIDLSFRARPTFAPESVDQEMCYDILLWSDTDMKFTLYSRAAGSSGPWEKEGSAEILGSGMEANGYAFVSLMSAIRHQNMFDLLKDIQDREYVIHVDQITQRGQNNPSYASWSATVNMRVSVVAGSQVRLNGLAGTGTNYQENYDALIANRDITSIGVPAGFSMKVTFTDTQAPNIENVSMIPSDTSPVISVIMDHPGQVNYIVFPLTGLRYAPDSTKPDTLTSVPAGTRLTPTVLTQIGNHYTTAVTVRKQGDNVQPAIRDIDEVGGTHIAGGAVVSNTGTPLDQPTREMVISNTFASGVIKGRSNFVAAGNASAIDLNGMLTANTVYYICMVTQGSTAQSWGDRAYGFYFVTDESVKPKLDLQIVDNSNAQATVDRTSNVYYRLALKSALTAPYTLTFDEIATSKPEGITNGFADDASSADKARYGSTTILQALIDDYPGGGSVFDHVASAELKALVERNIRTGDFPAQTVVDGRGPFPITATRQPDGSQSGSALLNPSNMDPGGKYVCFAIAASTTGSSYAFRAVEPLELVDSEPPLVRSVSVNFQTTGDGKAAKINGSVTINFNKVLYIRDSATAIYRLGHITKSTSDATITTPGGLIKVNDVTYKSIAYTGLTNPGNGISIRERTPVGEVSSIIFDFKDVPLNSIGSSNTWDFDMPSNLCNWWGATTPEGGNITIRFNHETGEITKTVPRSMQAPNYSNS